MLCFICSCQSVSCYIREQSKRLKTHGKVSQEQPWKKNEVQHKALLKITVYNSLCSHTNHFSHIQDSGVKRQLCHSYLFGKYEISRFCLGKGIIFALKAMLELFFWLILLFKLYQYCFQNGCFLKMPDRYL